MNYYYYIIITAAYYSEYSEYYATLGQFLPG